MDAVNKMFVELLSKKLGNRARDIFLGNIDNVNMIVDKYIEENDETKQYEMLTLRQSVLFEWFMKCNTLDLEERKLAAAIAAGVSAMSELN